MSNIESFFNLDHKMITAPVVLFTYNRPWHTRQTIETLKKNILAGQSDLIIYSDAAKYLADQEKVYDVRRYLRAISGFRSVSIIEREKNKGLADSIIEGVTEVVNHYGKIIVLEDDMITSPVFLNFMNDALLHYSDKKNIWHISGWNYPVDLSSLREDVFLWRVMNCWGWGTWADRWRCFEKNNVTVHKKIPFKRRKYFNLDGNENFFGQITANKKGLINTWAIYWYATIFLHSGLCVNPKVSFVDNIGLDGSGSNCGIDFNYSSMLGKKEKTYVYADYDVENPFAVSKISQWYRSMRKPLFMRVLSKVRRCFSINENSHT